MTTDPRKLAQELRNIAQNQGFESSDAADALDAALDEREWQKNAALFWREKDRISEAEIARLQDENERLNKALIRARTCLSVHDLAQVDTLLKENHDKQ